VEDEKQQRMIREGMLRKGKMAMSNSHRKELAAENLYVSKPLRRRDLRIGIKGSRVDQS